ncbi:unnamed protein product [Adineta ricciae]|uniref:Uncharacterized protein n=1 Tax=Adineta ricciae TaxID=249248 RepID=A0A815GJ13_ADIRI|nr:unnamed protein product [Adineta ricciae]
MGCGAGRSYTKKDIETHINKCQTRLPSAELAEDGTIKLTSKNGFFNASSLLNSQWLQGKLSNDEYRQAIEHINQRIGQSVVGSSKNLSIDQMPKSHSAKLAVEELNEKYRGRVHFLYRNEDQENAISTSESFLYINFK